MPRRRRRTRNEQFALNRARAEYNYLVGSEGRRDAGYYARKQYGRTMANPRFYRKLYKQNAKPKRRARPRKRGGLLGWLFG